MRPHLPNMEQLLNQISVEITRERTVQLFLSKIDLDYAYGQMKLSEETSRHNVFAPSGEISVDTIDSKKGFTDLPIYPPYFKNNLTEHSNTAHRHGWTI